MNNSYMRLTLGICRLQHHTKGPAQACASRTLWC